MKTLRRIKLNSLRQEDLADREMNMLRGGSNCSCGCMGVSSKASNLEGNKDCGYPLSCTCGCTGPYALAANQEANKGAGI